MIRVTRGCDISGRDLAYFGLISVDPDEMQRRLEAESYEADQASHPEESLKTQSAVPSENLPEEVDFVDQTTVPVRAGATQMHLRRAPRYAGSQGGAKSNLNHHSTSVRYRIRQRKQGSPKFINLF